MNLTLNERLDYIAKQYITDLIDHAEQLYCSGDVDGSVYLFSKVEEFADYMDNDGEVLWMRSLS